VILPAATTATATAAETPAIAHARHLRELTRMIDRHDHHPPPLGDAQQERRAAERAARAAAVDLVDDRHPQAAVARALQLAPQTLSTWIDRPAAAAAEPVPRGRPRVPVDPVQRADVAELLDSHGRSIGLPALKRLFPRVPRAALHDLRDRWADDHHVAPCRLTWTTPGAVWSADFTETPAPVDGTFDHVLLVRDLASRFILLAAPCIAQSADVVTFHCRQLFARHAAPLVLKTDNGSPFIAAGTRALCAGHGVVNLLSPPLTPEYNGSIEATAGAIKTRAACLAQHHACDPWTSDILEAARLAANAFGNPARGPAAPSPEQRWLGRAPIEEQRRAALAALIDQRTADITSSIQRERQEKGLPIELLAACRATVVRTAIRQALVELGYLQIRRPVITSTESSVVLSRN
jgi:transposase InsO family protein